MAHKTARTSGSTCEALRLFEKHSVWIDIIFSDLQMPGLTGLELLSSVRREDPEMPFILLSGKHDRTTVLAAKSAGVTSFIAKPFSRDEFTFQLRRAVALVERDGRA